MNKTLIFVPTYNERDNAPAMVKELFNLGLDADVLFTDDNSPDGTALKLEELKTQFPRLIVKHRDAKSGVGSAHAEAIHWAYQNNYDVLVTLDCDFTHSPKDIPRLLEKSNTYDIVVGSRWLKNGSLPGWNLFRKSMTITGHFLTKFVLGLKHDASGAFRVYRLDKIPEEIFHLILSKGYAFFLESLFVFTKNKLSIYEVPIVLPGRTAGNSKMNASAALKTVIYIFELFLKNLFYPRSLINK